MNDAAVNSEAGEARPRIAIIVVGYDSSPDIARMLASLPAGIAPHRPTLCLVDNASSDDTSAQFEAHSRGLELDVILHRTSENLGYTGGNNLGYELLSARGTFDFYVLLNPDTTVCAGWLDGLLEPFSQADVGIAGSLLLLPDGRLDGAGNGIHFLGFGFTRGFQGDAAHPPATRPSYASGASLAISRACVERVQALSGDAAIFWPALFLYHDDLDLGWRALLCGLRPALAVHSHVVHYHQWHGRPSNPRKFFFMERNRFLVLLANYKLATLLLLSPLLLASEVALRIQGGPYPAGRWALLRAVRDVIRAPGFWARRRRLQAHRVRSDRQILDYLEGAIDHPEVSGGSAWTNRLSAAAFRCLKLVVWW